MYGRVYWWFNKEHLILEFNNRSRTQHKSGEFLPENSHVQEKVVKVVPGTE